METVHFFCVLFCFAVISIKVSLVFDFLFQAKSICTVRSAVKNVCALFVFYCIFFLYYLWGWTVNDEGNCDVTNTMGNFMNVISPWLISALYAYCPLLIIFITSSAIVLRLMRASEQRNASIPTVSTVCI